MSRQKGGALLSTLKIERMSGVPLYRQLESAIRQLVLSGDLAANSRLPATRQLSQDLGVSRLTVKNVYEQLIAEGFLNGKPGAGTFVAEISTSEMPPEVAPPWSGLPLITRRRRSRSPGSGPRRRRPASAGSMPSDRAFPPWTAFHAVPGRRPIPASCARAATICSATDRPAACPS